MDNGGFESGLASWTDWRLGDADGEHGAGPHRQRLRAARDRAAGAEPGGDSYVSQTVCHPADRAPDADLLVPAVHRGPDLLRHRLQFDWQEAQIRRTRPGRRSASIFKSNSNSSTWTKVTFDMSAVRRSERRALVQRPPGRVGQPDDTWMYVDDVTLTAADARRAAPTGVTATAGQRVGDGELDGAVRNGGSAITKYTVTPYIGSTAQTPGHGHRQPAGHHDHGAPG